MSCQVAHGRLTQHRRMPSSCTLYGLALYHNFANRLCKLLRDHPATEVYVTGTFDDWGKSVKLEKKSGNIHERLVDLPQVEEKIYYKVCSVPWLPPVVT